MDQCSYRHDIPSALQATSPNRPGHDLELGINIHPSRRQCSPASGSIISVARTRAQTDNATLIDSHYHPARRGPAPTPLRALQARNTTSRYSGLGVPRNQLDMAFHGRLRPLAMQKCAQGQPTGEIPTFDGGILVGKRFELGWYPSSFRSATGVKTDRERSPLAMFAAPSSGRETVSGELVNVRPAVRCKYAVGRSTNPSRAGTNVDGLDLHLYVADRLWFHDLSESSGISGRANGLATITSAPRCSAWP